MKITFLTHSVDHIGGTIRATLNTASALAQRGHQVEVAAIFRRRATPMFAVDERVKLTALIDSSRGTKRPGALRSLRDRIRNKLPSRFYPAGDTRSDDFTALTDRLVAGFLRDCDADVIVGTRPGLNVYLAQFAPRRAVTVAQEHLFYDHHKPQLRHTLAMEYRKLDALVTVSEADAANYQHHMPHLAGKVSFIPNSIVPTPLEPSSGENKLIVAAGRITGPKRFDMLLDAFTEVHRRHPDWKLRIYGYGKRLARLRRTVEARGLGNAVSLMGQRTPLDPEWVKGSIAAMTSKYESFGLTLVEAMSCGLPVVSTDCDYGPPEIVDHEVDGLLTPRDDVKAFTEALCRLIEDDVLRKQMSVAALSKARRYLPDQIAADYEQLFRDLISADQRNPSHGHRVPAAPSRWYGLAAAPAGAGQAGGGPVTVATPRKITVDGRSSSFEDITLRLTGPARRVTLVCEEHPPVSIAVTRDGPTGVARLDPDTLAGLAEGVWSVCVYGASVAAGRIDSRELLRPWGSLPRSVVVPFAKDEKLALRVWRRDGYAEVDEVHWRDDTVHVTGRLLGIDWSARQVRAVTRLRKEPYTSLEFAADMDASGRFAIDIPAGALCEQRTGALHHWDVWLSDGTGAESAIRLGKFFDDIAERKAIQRFKVVECGTSQRGKARPYFTLENELSIRVTEPADGGAAALPGSESTFGVVGDAGAQLVHLTAQPVGQETDGDRNQERSVLPAPVRHRGHEWSIRFHQHEVAGACLGGLTQFRCVLERHVAGETEVVAAPRAFGGMLAVPGEAVHHHDVGGAFIVEDPQHVLVGFPVVDHQRLAVRLGQRDMGAKRPFLRGTAGFVGAEEIHAGFADGRDPRTLSEFFDLGQCGVQVRQPWGVVGVQRDRGLDAAVGVGQVCRPPR
jgi:glycosyltransferase involved in cell wall biosynthesis